MSPWDGINRRKFPRVSYPCLVTIRHQQDEKDVFLTHTENVGIGGVCVILKKGVKIFSPVEVELDLLDLEHHIKCPGKVVWSIRRKNTEELKPLFYDIGIEFDGLSDQDRKRLEVIIQRLNKAGKAVV